jgi:hypothetical protein
VYSCAGHNQIIRRVSQAEAVKMVQVGNGHWLRKWGKKTEIIGVRLADLERLKTETPPTITMGESMANVGLKGSKSWQKRVRAKIQAWPHVFDPKAANVRNVTRRKLTEADYRVISYA